MTNTLVGDVYLKIIEEVVAASTNDFEESGIGQATLLELQKEWQTKLSQRQVAQMPWDPKPEATPRPTNTGVSQANGAQAQYPAYENGQNTASNGARIKTEPGTEQYQNNPPTANYASMQPQQGGISRAQELVEQRFGAQAAAAIQRPGGLALPGQQAKPQGLQLPGQQMTPQQQQYAAQQHQMMQRQQQALQNQQSSPRIKVENDSPALAQGQFAQSPSTAPNYGQTDGADDMAEWKAMLAERRAMHAAHISSNDRYMRDQIASLSDELQSGLMVPLQQNQARIDARQRRIARRQPRLKQRTSSDNLEAAPVATNIAQLDGDVDDDEEKPDFKNDDDDDEDAINSDLDDPEDEQNPIGDDEDDLGDTILCTYDKVQRVKNKWKCTLKDGVLNTGGKEWLFHKGQGEFEW